MKEVKKVVMKEVKKVVMKEVKKVVDEGSEESESMKQPE